jgi:hypothetical protein
MVAALDKPIKREVLIEGEPYTLTLDADGVTVVRKRARKGFTVTWASLVEGNPQRQLDLLRSLEAIQAKRAPAQGPPQTAPRPVKKRPAG